MKERVSGRLAELGVKATPDVLDGCLTYLSLLTRGNRRMNLTALPLDEPIPGSSLDKLVVEPLLAADLVPETCSSWIDLGSGGGSPAIPLRLVRRQGFARLVEAKERKCAFLREAVRTLELGHTRVDAVRFEAMTVEFPVDLITVRAVRLDTPLLQQVSTWLRPGGTLMCFGGEADDSDFQPVAQRALPDGSLLQTYRRV